MFSEKDLRMSLAQQTEGLVFGSYPEYSACDKDVGRQDTKDVTDGDP